MAVVSKYLMPAAAFFIALGCAEVEDTIPDIHFDQPVDAAGDFFEAVDIPVEDQGQEETDILEEDVASDFIDDRVGDPDLDPDLDILPDPEPDPDIPPDPDPDPDIPPDPEPDPDIPPDPEPDPDIPPDPEPDPDIPPDPEPDPDIPPDPDVDDVPVDGSGWGDPVCGTGTTIPDCTLFPPVCTHARYEDYVTIAPLGTGRVVMLQIDIPDRRFLFVRIPFYDLEVSLTSPSGTTRTFWNRFYGGDTWDTDWDFITPWQIPVWWDEPVGGTWTLVIQDREFSGVDTVLSSWCLTPLDPSLHASVDPTAHLRSCYSISRAIPDYCEGDPSDSCTTHPIQMEIQVSEFVRASAIPNLTLNITHASAADLEMTLKAADGTDITVWNRGAGPIPSSIPLPAISGIWMTGRWALRIVDYVEYDTGTIFEWCVEAN